MGRFFSLPGGEGGIFRRKMTDEGFPINPEGIYLPLMGGVTAGEERVF